MEGTGIKVVTCAVIPYKNGFLYVLDEDKWGLPGGKVNPFERIDVAAPREIYEETGVQVVIKSLLGLWYHKSDRGNPILNTAYRAEIVEGTPKVVRPEEISDVRSFPLSKIRELYREGKIRSGLANVVPVERFLAGREFPLDTIDNLL